MRYFFFGSLRDQDVLERVIGRPAPLHSLRAAWLPGYRTVTMRDETFPMLLADAVGRVEGEVVEGLSQRDLERILFFESVEYNLRPVAVELHDGDRIDAHIFSTTERAAHDGEAWDYETWLREHKPRMLQETEIWMRFYGLASADEADRLWDEAVADGRPLDDVIRTLRAATVARRRVGT